MAPLDEVKASPAPNAAPSVNVPELLASGVQDIANHMVADGCKLNEVLRMILETMHRALGFRRIVFCLRDARTDTLIADATVPAIAQRLPAWFAQHIAAPSFLLLPLMMNAPFALINADQAQAGGISLGENELALLRTLRNQGVMAFRQAG